MARKFTATYLPYTFDELMKPVIMYEKAYDELEKQLDDLDVQRALLNLVDPELDKYAYEKNKALLDKLMGISEAMSSKGLNPSMRLTIAEMRRYQRSELDPLISAYKQREELIKELRSKGDNYIFSTDYSTTPLDKMLTGTNTYHAYNLEDALKEGMTSGKAISSRIYGNPQLSRELKNQYFKMTQGIPLDGRTVGQLFKDYPELLQDFDAWYELLEGNYNLDMPARFSDVDLRRAQDRYISGVLRGIVYNEDYKSNQGYVSPLAAHSMAASDWQRNWNLQQSLGAVGEDGNRHKYLGNGITMITPPSDRGGTGWGEPSFVDSKGNPISEDDARFEMSKGTFRGYDKDGNPQYDNGSSIQTYDKNDRTKRLKTETYTLAGKVNELVEDPYKYGKVNKKTEAGNSKSYKKFKPFNFDWSEKNNFFIAPKGSNWKGETERGPKNDRHDRLTTRRAIENGYEIYSAYELPDQMLEDLKNYIKQNYPESGVDLSDLLVYRKHEDGNSHSWWRVDLKPQAYGNTLDWLYEEDAFRAYDLRMRTYELGATNEAALKNRFE